MSSSIIFFAAFLIIFCQIRCSSLDLQHSSCTFYLNYNPDHTNFTFLGCSCSSDSKNCGSQQIKGATAWRTCTHACCDSSVEYAQTISSLQECQSYLIEQYRKQLMLQIFLPIMVFILFIVCCGCCKFGCYKCAQCCVSYCRKLQDCLLYIIHCKCCLRNRVEVNVRIERPQRQESSGQIQLEQVQVQQQQSWTLSHSKNPNLDDVCSVCLDGKTSLQLQCRHVYHRKCIIEWVKRKKQCILCRSKQMNSVRIYCQNCFNYFYQTTLIDQLDRFQRQRQLCESCRIFDGLT